MSKGAWYRPAALVTTQSPALSTEAPALANVVLNFPAGVAEAFGVEVFWFTAVFAHLTAQRVVAGARIAITNFAVGHR